MTTQLQSLSSSGVFGGQPRPVEKNTFLEFEDDACPPTPCASALVRANTAPACGRFPSSESASTAAEFDISSLESGSRLPSPKGDDSASVGSAFAEAAAASASAVAVATASNCESPRLQSLWFAPSAMAVAVAEAVPAVACEAAPVEKEEEDEEAKLAEVGTQLRVKNTFLEYYTKRCLRRSRSFPRTRSEEEEEAAEAEMKRSAELEEPVQAEHMDMSSCPGSPTGEDMPVCWWPQGFMPVADQNLQWPVFYYPVAVPVAMEVAPAPAVETSEHGDVAEHNEASEPSRHGAPMAQQKLEASASEMVWKPSFNNRKAARGSNRESERRTEGDRRQGSRNNVDEDRALDVIAQAARSYAEGRRSQVWALSRKDGASSLIVQEAIKIAAKALRQASEAGDDCSAHEWEQASYEAQALIAGLESHVHVAIEHPHANYVIQQVVEQFPAEYSGFVAWELAGHGLWATRHRFGCRVVLRIIGHCDSEGWGGDAARSLLEEVLPKAADLVFDQFGNYVVQELLVRGIPEHRHEVAQALLTTLLPAATHQHGSRVVESALECCSEADSKAIAAALLKSNDSLRTLIGSEYGCFVLKALLKSRAHSALALLRLRPFVHELQRTWYSRRLVGLVMAEGKAARAA